MASTYIVLSRPPKFLHNITIEHFNTHPMWELNKPAATSFIAEFSSLLEHIWMVRTRDRVALLAQMQIQCQGRVFHLKDRQLNKDIYPSATFNRFLQSESFHILIGNIFSLNIFFSPFFFYMLIDCVFQGQLLSFYSLLTDIEGTP